MVDWRQQVCLRDLWLQRVWIRWEPPESGTASVSVPLRTSEAHDVVCAGGAASFWLVIVGRGRALVARSATGTEPGADVARRGSEERLPRKPCSHTVPSSSQQTRAVQLVQREPR